MKKSNPIRKTTTAAAQITPKTKTPDDFSLPPDDDHPSCLCIYDRLSKGPVTRIPITEDEFFAVLKVQYEPGQFHGMTAEKFIASAIREKLESAKQQGGKPSNDLEGTINQAEAASIPGAPFLMSVWPETPVLGNGARRRGFTDGRRMADFCAEHAQTAKILQLQRHHTCRT